MIHRNLLAAAAVAVAAGLAQAQSGAVIHTDAVTFAEMPSGGNTDVVSRVYDQWTSPPSNLTSVFVTGGNQIADDLNMLPVGAGWLQTLGFAVGNANGAAGSAFTGGQVRIAFYRQSDGSAIQSINGFSAFTANLPALNLAPGGSSRINFGATGLASLGWYFDTPNIYASLQITAVTGTGGFTLDNAGMQTRAGGVIGSSTDNLWNLGPGGTTGPFNFGGTPVANSAWFIDVDTVPAPGTVTLLALGGLIASRRRR